MRILPCISFDHLTDLGSIPHFTAGGGCTRLIRSDRNKPGMPEHQDRREKYKEAEVPTAERYKTGKKGSDNEVRELVFSIEYHRGLPQIHHTFTPTGVNDNHQTG